MSDQEPTEVAERAAVFARVMPPVAPVQVLRITMTTAVLLGLIPVFAGRITVTARGPAKGSRLERAGADQVLLPIADVTREAAGCLPEPRQVMTRR